MTLCINSCPRALACAKRSLSQTAIETLDCASAYQLRLSGHALVPSLLGYLLVRAVLVFLYNMIHFFISGLSVFVVSTGKYRKSTDKYRQVQDITYTGKCLNLFSIWVVGIGSLKYTH
jgi:hypothetical protein